MTSLEALIYCIVAVLITFFICAIPSGYLISKQGSHVDVRKEGSGNIGTTNVARSVGKGAAALTLLCDAGKGLSALDSESSLLLKSSLGELCGPLFLQVLELDHGHAFAQRSSWSYFHAISRFPWR